MCMHIVEFHYVSFTLLLTCHHYEISCEHTGPVLRTGPRPFNTRFTGLTDPINMFIKELDNTFKKKRRPIPSSVKAQDHSQLSSEAEGNIMER